MTALCDDVLGLILNWVKDSNDRKSVSQVCTQWRRVEGQNRSSIRVHDLDFLPALLHRFPNLVTFQTSESISNKSLELLAQGCPKLEVLDLTAGSRKTVQTQGLCTIANRCPKLSKVLLRWRCFRDERNGTTALLGPFADKLMHLEMVHCSYVCDKTLFGAIGSSTCFITVLNLEGSKVTDRGLKFLAEGSCSKTIRELNWLCDITDLGVLFLPRMCVLEELDLAYCRQITDVGGVALSAIQTLKKLNLRWGPKVTHSTIVVLARNLETLEY